MSMGRELRALIVEDNEVDAELLTRLMAEGATLTGADAIDLAVAEMDAASDDLERQSTDPQAV